ncbi:MAG: hypothetical protein A3C43_04765 [Candidatus Schekmanbacteria bacterium RIFCSPHIGHO2_02_FULL_38_11]|uniref:Transporter n=1 Tax=Candidatus Schekmanbacteria bacterium RIFCSPLOWO2_12_FULL_38_15 TaxID=1817883 RepID=A0A1F7SQG5_9BACT|nr:MAG: hypothetical protein A2043_05345 [Candidatus Schekmanbacteria bacterium GWA2_38_9]OGL48497.1 MAG: hypothetical protein A3C43_04765 [Candidatus Schekmanbacteria bacterium RIFCSPHIGHO2_02_FULL_38_11]OGL50232.1 MAG: hypothetical protein A3H37_00560 [Candidatus Schekmanbacteria bacterium RIFCSPLOWO2_02_FULL_38_14]OGL55457.1 MAG: hypothetical protein A3G31_01440 [Candidatus Schekmanbacteria bacterium RIFCSPLOWO2_12_FULL_38_15]
MKNFLIITFVVLISLFNFLLHAFEESHFYPIEEVIEIAIKENPQLKAFKAGVDASQGDLIQASLYPNPEIEGEGLRGRALGGESKRGKEYNFTLSQPFEWPLKRFYRKKVAGKDVDIATLELEEFKLDLTSQVKTSFYEILKLEKELTLTKENLSDSEKILTSVKVRVESGEAPEFELIKAQVEVLRAEKELKKAENKIIIAKSNLNSLLGKFLPEGFDVSGELKAPYEIYEINPLLNIAYKKQPLLLQKESGLQKQQYNISFQKNNRFPDISLKTIFAREIDKRSFGFGFSLPLPLWNRNQGAIARASAEERKAQEELNQIKIELSRLITEELKNYQISSEQIEIFEKGLLKQAEEALRIAKLRYVEGESGLIDFLDAQRVYRQVSFEYYQTLFEGNSSKARLERLAGGELR